MDKLIKMFGALLFILKAKDIITSDEYDLITLKITPEEFNERMLKQYKERLKDSETD